MNARVMNPWLILMVVVGLVVSGCNSQPAHRQQGALSTQEIQAMLQEEPAKTSPLCLLKTCNRTVMWQSLLQLPADELVAMQSDDDIANGWVELALIAQSNDASVQWQARQLGTWQSRFAQHPAAQTSPREIIIIEQLIEQPPPQQLALIVPLSGRLAVYGQAIREGFIAAFYQAKQSGEQVPQLVIYDSDASAGFMSVYQMAIDDGADVVVGPLTKAQVNWLAQQKTLPVPTLALNRADTVSKRLPEQLYQFALATDDEAKQLAIIAAEHDRHQAMVIAPRNDWGERTRQAFIEQWQAQGGTVVATSWYVEPSDYAHAIKDALQIPLSEARYKRIASLVDEKLEFTPRRRQDIDMVLLLARPDQARSIKPLLNYYYASDLPVYATSRTYLSVGNQGKNQDINDVHVLGMPWVLTPPDGLHTQVHQVSGVDVQYQDMVALGIDSFQLYPRLEQLASSPYSRLQGQTGILRMNHKRQVERELLLATIKNGRPVLE